LATEEGGAGGAAAGVKTGFQLETSLQAAAHVFRAFEAEAGGVVEQAGLGDIAFFLVFERGVNPAVQGHAALGERGGGSDQGQRSQGATVHLFHGQGFLESNFV
jgi:hypothetical protein